jgi:hypothetical protein
MQKEFNKLSIDKQRKFIVKNLLRNEYFKDFHEKIKNIFIEDIYPKNQQKDLVKIRNCLINDKITTILRKYKDNVIDLYSEPTNKYFYDQALKQKNKLENMLNLRTLYYKDEYGFMTMQLVTDVWGTTKDIIASPELSLESIIKRIPDYIDDLIED